MCLSEGQAIKDRQLERESELIKPDADFTRNKTLTGPFMAFTSQVFSEPNTDENLDRRNSMGSH